MLTKDLLRYRVMGNSVRPSFIRTDDPALLDFAASLIAVYEGREGATRAELEEASSPLVSTLKDMKTSKGLNKLVLDRCQFAACSDYDYPTLRKALFAKSASLLKAGAAGPYDGFRDEVFAGCAGELAFLKGAIYADLPDNERLLSMRRLFPKELLERYNCALVQGLLLFCAKLDATVAEPDPSKMRRLFKYLKFFRLLARLSLVEGSESGPSKVRIEVDGPASLFENTLKYGLQLASFLPAIVQVSKWSIDCEVKLRERLLKLKLDESSGLASHYGNFGAYIPEEVSMFHRLFKEKVHEWRVAGGSPFIRAEGQCLIFPDLSFESADGRRRMHLELFHKWHSSQLLPRLEFCERNPSIPLLLGVDRGAAADTRTKAALEGSAWFSRRGFLFRDFPGVDTVRRLLDSSAADASSGSLSI